MPTATEKLLLEFGAGKSSALARAVSIVENHRPGVDEILSAVHPKLGRARRIGITGPPGAGKSTITTLVAKQLRAAGHSVGIIAAHDSYAPKTEGAVLLLVLDVIYDELGPEIKWIESYVTADKIYCVYRAPSEELIREHARRGGFPADSVAMVTAVIDPGTAEVAA